MTRRAELTEVRVDFVGDPVIFEEECEESADEPKDPAAREPGRAEIGTQEGNVNEVGGGITQVGEEGERGHWEKIGEMERGAEVWPGSRQPDDANGEEDEVIEDAARFPETGGGGEEPAEAVATMAGECLRGHGGYLLDGERIRRELYVVKYFVL